MRALVLGFHKFPEGQVKADIVLYCTVLYCTVQVVVDTAVLLERDRDNFIHLLDLWAAQVAPAPGHNPSNLRALFPGPDLPPGQVQLLRGQRHRAAHALLQPPVRSPKQSDMIYIHYTCVLIFIDC